MKTKVRLPGLVLLLPLLQVAPGVVAEEAPFTYSDDWSLVSAPPPPGPYRTVNIDPRVPGQDAIPPISTGAESMHSWEQLPPEIVNNPPAAGIPATAPAMEAPLQQEMLDPYGPAPVPGAYQGYRQIPPDSRYAEPARMPNPEQYSTYGSMPPTGYYQSPDMQAEPDVPPPPVYDAMTGETGGAYGRPRGQ